MQIKAFTFNPIQENTYLVYDETKECVIIDAGCFFPQEEQALADFMEANELKLKRVINTHLHFDHAFGNAFLARQYGVLPEAHMGDEYMIPNMPEQAKRFGFNYTVLTQNLGSHLNEGDIIKFGNTELKAIHVPGHSPGSLCYYNEKAQVLFAGDVLFLESIGRTDLDQGDYGTLVNGIANKLFTLPNETKVYCGHGPSTTIGHEKTHNPFL